MSSPHRAAPDARREVVLGVLGGSGLYAIDGLENIHQVDLDTPFGKPSGPYTTGQLSRERRAPIKVVFVPRHGPGHTLLPGEVNYRANMHGLKQLGVTHVLSVSAVGSLRESIVPGHVVVPDQLIDRTKHREHTFFGDGLVAHIQFGDPFCPLMRTQIRDAATAEGAQVHDGGALVVMEGPAFSTRAESNLYRSWGADLIGMTALPEAKLALEAELGYAILALATDYDCWRVGKEEVSVDGVIAALKRNVSLARAIVARLATALPETTAEFPYPRVLEHALITTPDAISAAARERLDLIIGHLL